MKFFIVIFFSFFLSLFTYSQEKIVVIFKIINPEIPCGKDSTNKKLTFQYKLDNSYVDIRSFNSSKCINRYSVSKVMGEYKVVVSAKNYDINSSTFEITEQTPDTLEMDERVLMNKELSYSANEKEIHAVTINGKREKLVQFEANKTTYAVKNNDLLSGGNVEDALKKIPGVIKGFGGELTVNGKSIAIYIDNSPTGLSGSDLGNLLQSMPASSIEKIEIINNPGASYEANTGGGIINIITNGNALRGINGAATLNYRFNRNNKISPSININSRLNKVSLQLNSGFNYREWNKTSSYEREFTHFSPSVFFYQKGKDEGYDRYYFFRPSANIRLGNKSNLIVNYNYSYTYNNIFNTTQSESINPINSIDLSAISKSTNKNTNHEVITQYKTQLDSLGTKFDITAYFLHYDKISTNKNAQNNLGVNSYSINDIDLGFNNFYAKSNFELPIKKIDLSVNLGGKYSLTYTSSLGKYNLMNSSSSILELPVYKSNLTFDYDEYQYAFYTEINKNIKKLSITAGLRYENMEYKSHIEEYNRKVNNKMDKLYPSFSLLYKITPILNFNGSFRRSISLPSFASLDPNMSGYYDEFNTNTGNPYLKPDFYNNYEVSLSAFNYLRLGFQYTYSKQVNLLSFKTEDNSLIVNQTTQTYNGMKNYNVSLGIPLPFGLISQGKDFFKNPMNIDKMSFVYFYSMYNYFKLDDYPYMNKVKPIWFFYFYTQISLPAEFKLTGFYLFSTNKGNYKIYTANNPFTYSSIELSKSFYNKAFKTSFGVDNLFNSSKIAAGIMGPNLNTNLYQRDENQVFYLKLSYNFGKFKNLKKENTIIENDKQKNNSTMPSLSL